MTLAIAAAIALIAGGKPNEARAADGTTDVTVQVAEGDENLAWSVPTQIPMKATAGGTLIGPGADAIAIRNLSAFPIRVKQMDTTAEAPFNLVDDVDKSSGNNDFMMTVNGAAAKQTVELPDDGTWAMGYEDNGEGSDVLPLTVSSAKIARVTEDISAAKKAATITWTVEPTTTIKPEPKPDSENGTVFAIDFNEPGTTKFYKRDRVPDAGEVFEGKTVEADNIYTGSRMSELNSDTLYTSIWDNTDRFKARSVEVVDSGIKLSDLPKFHDTHNISSLNLTKLDTSQETSFYRLFDTIDKLCVLDVSTWDTSSVTNMNDCFNACGSKSTQTFTVDLSGWDTSSVTYMDEMFQDSNIKVKGLRNFDTSKVISMCSMFSGSPAANKDIENWNTSSLENIHYMFSYSTSTDSLNLSKWNVSQVNDFESLFKNSKFNSLNLSGWNVSGSEQLDYPDRVLQFMFSGCSASNIDVSNWNISNVDDTSSMFEGCSALTRIVGISDWNTKRLNLVYSMFKDCPNLVLDLSGWNVEYVNTLLPLDFNTGSPGVIAPKFNI